MRGARSGLRKGHAVLRNAWEVHAGLRQSVTDQVVRARSRLHVAGRHLEEQCREQRSERRIPEEREHPSCMEALSDLG